MKLCQILMTSLVQVLQQKAACQDKDGDDDDDEQQVCASSGMLIMTLLDMTSSRVGQGFDCDVE